MLQIKLNLFLSAGKKLNYLSSPKIQIVEG